MRHTIFFTIFLLLDLRVAVEGLCCGKVYDGPKYKEDIDHTNAHHRIYASWSGFQGNCTLSQTTTAGLTRTRTATPRQSSTPTRSHTQSLAGASGRSHNGGRRAFSTTSGHFKGGNVTYYIAVISEKIATGVIRASGWDTQEFYPRCRLGIGLDHNVKPDVVDWTYVDNHFYYINLNITLQSGIRYYTLLRAHDPGHFGSVFTNTNGFVPNFSEGSDDDDGEDDEFGNTGKKENDDEDGDEDDEGNLNDDANDADDDDDIQPWQAGLVALAVAILVLLMVFTLICLVHFAFRFQKRDKYNTRVPTDNIEKI